MRDDVLIAGAGPTGLVLALWLVKQGVKIRIIDKAPGPGTASRAMAVQARTLELYRQLDLAEAVVAAGHKTPAVNLWVKGKRQAHVPLSDAGKDLTPYPFLLAYPQDVHERLLVEKLASLGVMVERNTELTGFTDKGDHIEARLRDARGQETVAEASYLAGCDGARSAVRHLLGSGFPGDTYSKIFYVADTEIAGPSADGEVHIALDTSDFLAVMAYNDHGNVRLIGTVNEDHDDAAGKLTFEDVSHRAIDGLGVQVKSVKWFSTYRVHHRVTDHYRMGRAFLLGDAAHVHSPAGGQGMNTGIGDAINLAWKLAAVLKARAPDALLDSYEAERKAFAEKLVHTTDRVFSFVTAEGSFADFVRTRIAPLFMPFAYRAETVREFMFRIISQTMISYHGSAVSEGLAGEVRGGDRLPWVPTRSCDNYAPLSVIGWQAHVYGAAHEDVVDWCSARGVPLYAFTWTKAHGKAGLARNALYLIRPDSYVAFASAEPRARALEHYTQSRGMSFS
ncbi:FAD-dependent monooxygenase [Aestuariivirga sp.]|uniref:FAD-dependent monooxygenase n=1 Tax=Aestuariivirga sp. TaxID=2650926 RepID=UPI0039E36071